MANEEYKFPDEKIEAVQDADDSIEVKIEDDTPPQDRGRAPLPKEIVEELEKDDLEEYSDKVKKRLSQMKKVWHDERRAKEAAAREKEEALRFAQQQMQFAQQRENEVRQLRQRLGNGEKAYFQEVTKSANNDLTTAKERLKQAYEAGDAEKITEAQEALTEAKESARFFRGYNTQITADVSFNWRSFYHFQSLRNKPNAQLEIQEIAQKMLELVKNIENNPFKYTIEAFGL